MIGVQALIDGYIEFLRDFVSELLIVERDLKFENIIKKYLKLDMKSYGYILDCLYLFEDTMEANKNYREFGLRGPSRNSNTGEKYIRLYGLLNSCYLQKVALKRCADVLKINVDDFQDIYKNDIFEIRNVYAAHTPDRNNRSYVLSRISLEKETVQGYSYEDGKDTKFIKNDLPVLLNDWEFDFLKGLKKIVMVLFDRFNPEMIDTEIYLRLQKSLMRLNISND